MCASPSTATASGRPPGCSIIRSGTRAPERIWTRTSSAVRSYGEPVACGIELDWIEGREDELGALVEDRDFDLVLGSVHWLGGLAVDHPDYAIWEDVAADEVWRRYFAQVRAAAASGLFDVLAHLDLAKVFGNTASRSVVESEHEDTADAIAAAGVAIEISTAGLRKAAGELYPAPGLLRALHRRGVPITLGSDGHVPEDLGRDYDRALSAAHECGYRRISMFTRPRAA